jgi:pimeloyl-ACP methyl ester carboxylesterase
MAARYIADLRDVQPQGPYYLGGYCFGGNVAYEMACQLTEQGHEVAMLALLNCATPQLRLRKDSLDPSLEPPLCQESSPLGPLFLELEREPEARVFSAGNGTYSSDGSVRGETCPAVGKNRAGELVDLSAYTEEQKGIWEHHIRALLSFRPGRTEAVCISSVAQAILCGVLR